MNQRLNIFISSTSDLKRWRTASAKALSDLNIDDLRFESWPSSPNDPINECLLNIEESDGLILIIGKNYGTITKGGISATHLEFRHAIKHGRPIFAYFLKKHHFEPKQVEFIKEIENSKFRCQPIISIKNLQDSIKDSFTNEFARCFRKVHSPPDRIDYKSFEKTKQDDIVPTEDENSTYKLLLDLYNKGNDLQIHNYSNDCINKFSNSPDILNIIYMAGVNLGINGYSIEESHLKNAIYFWSSHISTRRWEIFSLNYNIGNAYLTLGDYEKSIKFYKISLKEYENHPECWHNLGSAYKGKKSFKLALKSYEKSLKLNPKLFNSLLSIAIYYYRIENDPNSAIEYLNKISIAKLSLKYKSHILGWKANINLDLGDYETGIANVEDALHYVQDEDWPWFIAGRLYGLIRVKNHDWLEFSENFWKRFINKFPNNSQAWAELGFIYWFQKNKNSNAKLSEKCLLSFEKAIELGYDDELAYDRIGHLYQDKQDYVNAEKSFRKATMKNQKDFGYCLGVCLILMDRYDDALKYVLDAAEKYQPDYLSWFQLGYCHLKLFNIDKAEYALKKAIELNSDYPEAYFNLGGLYWNNNQIDKAKDIWEVAIKKFPEHELCSKAIDFLNSIN